MFISPIHRLQHSVIFHDYYEYVAIFQSKKESKSVAVNIKPESPS